MLSKSLISKFHVHLCSTTKVTKTYVELGLEEEDLDDGLERLLIDPPLRPSLGRLLFDLVLSFQAPSSTPCWRRSWSSLSRWLRL